MTYESARELFYRCQHLQLVHAVESLVEEKDFRSEHLPLILLKISSLYELHQIDKLEKEWVHCEEKSNEINSSEWYFFQGKIAYYRDNFTFAEESFRKSLAYAKSSLDEVYAQLGLGNVFFSTQKTKELREVLTSLSNESHQPPEVSISIDILHSNFLLESKGEAAKVRTFLHQAMQTAANLGWIYFIQRCFYGLAILAKREKNAIEMRTLLTTLQAMTNPKESLFFSYLVNKEFIEETCVFSSEMTFDDELVRVRVNNQWRSFHGRPLLYHFLKLLSREDKFYSKEEVSMSLWPTETYHPQIHDPRVYDVARRARAMIEAFEEQPIYLLSGRSGYRLAKEFSDSKEVNNQHL